MHIRKSATGVAALEQRSVKLSLLARRLLILIDGQRPHAELQTLMGSNPIDPLLEELLAHDCIEVENARATPVLPVTTPEAPSGAMPERSAKQLDMGRHFMINTLSSFCGPFAHADLMAEALKAPDQVSLRQLVPAWRAALAVQIPAKRLATLQDELLRVI